MNFKTIFECRKSADPIEVLKWINSSRTFGYCTLCNTFTEFTCIFTQQRMFVIAIIFVQKPNNLEFSSLLS